MHPIAATATNLAKDLQHAMFKQVFSGLARAPIHNIPLHNVLDIATGKTSSDSAWDIALTGRLGTGVWAIEFGTLYPVHLLQRD